MPNLSLQALQTQIDTRKLAPVYVFTGEDTRLNDRMVDAGITSILNFAPTVLSVPDGVDVRKVDLSIELQILAYHVQRKAAANLVAAEEDSA